MRHNLFIIWMLVGIMGNLQALGAARFPPGTLFTTTHRLPLCSLDLTWVVELETRYVSSGIGRRRATEERSPLSGIRI